MRKLILTMTLLVIAVLGAGCAKTNVPDYPGTPDDVVKEYLRLTAQVDVDYEGIMRLMSSDLQGIFSEEEFNEFATDEENQWWIQNFQDFESTRVLIEGATAVVEGTIYFLQKSDVYPEGMDSSMGFNLVKEDSEWKLSAFTSTREISTPTEQPGTASPETSPSTIDNIDNLVLSSISPPDGTRLKAGETVEVTAEVSYSLATLPAADIALMVGEQYGTITTFSKTSVTKGSDTIIITGDFQVPDVSAVEIHVFMFPARTAEPKEGSNIVPLDHMLAAVYFVETVEEAATTTTPSEESPGITGSVSDAEGDTAFGFIDIVDVRVSAEEEEVTVQIELADLPAELTFNQAPDGTMEYGWNVYFDVDGSADTGPTYRRGSEYALSVTCMAFGETTEDTILRACQGNVWELEDSSMRPGYDASIEVDHVSNTLIIRGRVPGLNADSRWFAVATYWDPKSERSKVDEAPNTGYALMSSTGE